MPYHQLREQKAHFLVPQKRASVRADESQAMPASPQGAAHPAGLHPEDQPSASSPVSRRSTRPAPATTADVEDAHAGPTRLSPMLRDYRRAPLLQQEQASAPPRKRLHWQVCVGLALLTMILGWAGLNALGSFIHEKQDDWTYGYPRTYQTDANVGHHGRVSHFIVVNLHGEIEVIETQQGHPQASQIYTILILPADQDRVPATLSFQELNGDVKVDAVVHVGATEIPLYNTGTSFQSQPPK